MVGRAGRECQVAVCFSRRASRSGASVGRARRPAMQDGEEARTARSARAERWAAPVGAAIAKGQPVDSSAGCRPADAGRQRRGPADKAWRPRRGKGWRRRHRRSSQALLRADRSGRVSWIVSWRPLIDHCIRFCYREQQSVPAFWTLPVTMPTITRGGVTRWRENGADHRADPALSRPVSSDLRGRPR